MAEAIRVLYVDDESALLDLCQIFLERSGDFTVTTATSAPEAIRILELKRFDAIVSDYQMPEMNGIEFLKVVRARGDKTPFIIFTGKGREEVVIEALNSGADFYLQKGGEPKSQFAELIHKIRHGVSLRQADKALIASEERYRTVFENTGSATMIIEEDNTISLVNTGFEHLSGFTKKELEGKKRWTEFVVKTDLDRMLGQHKLRRVDKDKALKQYEFRFIMRSGEIRDIFLNVDIIPGTKKSVASLIDITERKIADDELRETNEYFHKLIDFANAPIIVWDPEFRITRFNRASEHLTGRAEQEVLGQTLDILFPQGTRDASLALIKQTFAGERWESVEIPLLASDGIIHTVLWNSANILTAEADLISTIAQGVDITERKKAEEALRESEERFRYISELIPDFAYSSKKASGGEFVLDWITGKPEQITGYTADAIKEMTCWKFLVIDEDIPVFEKNVTGLLPGESARCELRIRRKDGGIIWLSSYAKCVADAKEQRFHLLYGGCRDITDRKNGEEVLERSNEKFQSLFMHMSEGAALHELMYNDQGIPEDYIILEVNPAFESQLGIARNAVIGKTSREAYRVAEPPYLEIYARVALTGEPKMFETYFPPMAKHFSISVFCPFKGSFATVFEDITGRKSAEEGLQVIQEKYTKAFLSVPDAITISELDSGRFIEVNDAATRTFGYSRDELIGKSPLELGIWKNKEEQSRLIDQVREHGNVSHFEVLNRRKSGEPFYASVNADTTTLGNVPCLIAVTRDITDRKNVEDALRENEAKFRSILENLPELILVHRNGTILYTNPVAVETLGYQPHEVITRRVADFIAPEFHERVAAAVLRRMEGKPVEPYEIDVIGKRGNRRNMIVNGSMIEFDGAPASIIILTDITERKKVEENLKKSELRFRAVVEDQTEFICRFTPDGRLTFVNDAYCRYFGLNRNQCLAKSHRVVLPPEDARLMKKHLASLTPENPVAAIDHRIIMSSGEVRWQRWNDRAIFDESGRVIEYQSVGRDFTEAKIVEIALHDSEERFQQIAESAGEWIWEVDMDGVYTYSNAMVYQILGYTMEEIIKRKHFYDFFVPEDQDPLKADAFRAFANHDPFKGFVNTNLRKNGDRVILETAGSPILDANGKLTGYRGTDIDITARMKAEESLRQRERELSDIISFLPDATLVIDKNGKVLAWNRAIEVMTGVPAEQMLGKADYEYAIPFYHERRPITADFVLHEDPAIAAKYPFIDKQGNARFSEIFIPHFNKGRGAYLRFKASPLYDAAGNVSGAIETIRDITDRKRAEEALLQANKQLNLLSSITRHDILNLLIVLRGYIELSRDFLEDKKRLVDFMEKEETAVRSIEDQIMFTRDYQDLGIAVPEWQNVNTSVQKAVAGLPMRDILAEADRSDLEIYADPLFGKVFYNLIENALNYGGAKMKTIRVSSEVSEREMIIVCEDDGAGISLDDKKHLFTRGFGKHTGLGLFLTREILAITGITITENGEPGKGARFRITVPEGAYRFTGNKEK
jgi:PAS domain S-box-containing protein